MKLISWNIRQGGGQRRDAICSALVAHDPDVIVLSEARGDSVSDIRSSIWMQPWAHCVSTASERKVNALCALSKTPVTIRDCCPVPDENAPRWLDLDLPTYGFAIGALHIPGASRRRPEEGGSKQRFWATVLKAAADRLKEPFLFIGDLNTGIRGIDESGRTFHCSDEFAGMSTLGWTDAWRHFHGSKFEATWLSHKGKGFRIDHAFVSPTLLDRVVSCDYSHIERQKKISDHSILMLEIAHQ